MLNKKKQEMNSKIVICLLILLAWTASKGHAQTPATEQKAPCKPCAELKDLHLPDVRILTAEVLEKPVPYCKISGVIGKEIHFEVALPEA
jgi:hypothetical protein